jgi:putative transposase
MARKVLKKRKAPTTTEDGPVLQNRRVTFRIYPNATQEAILVEWLGLHCELYNAALQERKEAYEKAGKSVDYVKQANQLPEIKALRPEMLVMGSHALQATLRRVDLAFQHFFDRVKVWKAGNHSRKPGYPRFKARARFKGWTCPDHDNWKLAQATPGKHGFLEIRNLGKLRIRGQARTWGKETTLTITRKAGQWFASVTVACLPERESGKEAHGFDWGLESFLVLSNGEEIKSPRLLKAAEEKLKRAQRDLSRKVGPTKKNKTIKPSNGWLKQKSVLRRIHADVANQREDFHHQVSAKLVKRAALLATETLSIMNMTASAKGTVDKPGKNVKQKAGLNRAILDSAPRGFLSKLVYKAVEARCQLDSHEARQHKPSQTCPGCGRQEKKTLQQRVHSCPACGLLAGRDHASALVMLNLSLTGKAWEPGLRGANLLPPGRGAA